MLRKHHCLYFSCVFNISYRKSSFLDSVSEANLALDGGRFLDCLLRKVLSMRKVGSNTNVNWMGRGTWRHVMFAAQSLGVEHS